MLLQQVMLAQGVVLPLAQTVLEKMEEQEHLVVVEVAAADQMEQVQQMGILRVETQVGQEVPTQPVPEEALLVVRELQAAVGVGAHSEQVEELGQFLQILIPLMEAAAAGEAHRQVARVEMLVITVVGGADQTLGEQEDWALED